MGDSLEELGSYACEFIGGRLGWPQPPILRCRGGIRQPAVGSPDCLKARSRPQLLPESLPQVIFIIQFSPASGGCSEVAPLGGSPSRRKQGGMTPHRRWGMGGCHFCGGAMNLPCAQRSAPHRRAPLCSPANMNDAIYVIISGDLCGRSLCRGAKRLG
jgi:hypothetical protein